MHVTRFSLHRRFETHNDKIHKIHTGCDTFDCSTCTYSFSKTCVQTSHIRIHKERKLCPCLLRRNKFFPKSRLWETYKRHTTTTTEKLPSWQNFLNMLEFWDTYYWDSQKYSHTERSFDCCTCTFIYSQSSILKSHSRICIELKPLPWTQCGNKFTLKVEYGRHIKDTHAFEQLLLKQMCAFFLYFFFTLKHIKKLIGIFEGECFFNCYPKSFRSFDNR